MNKFSNTFIAGGEDTDAAASTKTPAEDDFEQLRMAREKERFERQKQKIARSVSQQTGGSLCLDTDLLLEQITNSRCDGLNRNSYTDPN